jgi:uncharacterized protein (DUF488 family)
MEKLDGRRKQATAKVKEKEKEREKNFAKNNNNAWQNKSFTAYSDYMATTAEFKEGVEEMISIKKSKDISFACMTCAEVLPWRCHRRLVSDYLTILGISVYDIIDRSQNANKN